MGFVFDINKDIQVAAYLLNKAMRKMNYMKLLKLMYLADREMLKERALPITGDSAFAMQRGPVLSRTYDLIHNSKSSENASWQEQWDRHFKTTAYEILLLEDCDTDELSRCELSVLNRVYEQFVDCDQWEMSELTHEFPEWEKNYLEGTSSEISLYDILQGVDREADFKSVDERRSAEFRDAKLFGQVGN